MTRYAIERDNPKLKGKLPRDYARRGILPERMGGLIDMIGSIAIGTDQARAKDILGRVYEYFFGKFTASEGKLGGEFFTLCAEPRQANRNGATPDRRRLRRT
jgi:type I restriction enzyme M protein